MVLLLLQYFCICQTLLQRTHNVVVDTDGSALGEEKSGSNRGCGCGGGGVVMSSPFAGHGEW